MKKLALSLISLFATLAVANPVLYHGFDELPMVSESVSIEVSDTACYIDGIYEFSRDSVKGNELEIGVPVIAPVQFGERPIPDCFALTVDGAETQDHEVFGSYIYLFRSPIPRLNLEVPELPADLKIVILVKKLKVDVSKPIKIHLRYTQPYFQKEKTGYYLPVIEPLQPRMSDQGKEVRGKFRIRVFSKDSSISVGPEYELDVVSSSEREVLIEAQHMQLISFENRANKRPEGTSAKAPPSNPSQGAAVPHP